MMTDWKVSSYVDPNNTKKDSWVYYENPHFPGIHMSRCVGKGASDHMATNDRTAYYYGASTPAGFNSTTLPAETQKLLKDAWTDYFTVR